MAYQIASLPKTEQHMTWLPCLQYLVLFRDVSTFYKIETYMTENDSTSLCSRINIKNSTLVHAASVIIVNKRTASSLSNQTDSQEHISSITGILLITILHSSFFKYK